MIPLEFFYVLDILLLSRFGLAINTEKIETKDALKIYLIQVGGLLVLEINITWFLLLTVLGIMMLSQKYIEDKSGSVYRYRSISLGLIILIVSFMVAPWSQISFNSSTLNALQEGSNYFVFWHLFSTQKVTNLLILIMGLTLVTSEANTMVRYILEKTNFSPQSATTSNKPEAGISQGEFNAGRIIGMLERILIYLFVIEGEFSAIAFILAAKSFARFKDLENKGFAEYVLIGTLLSSFLAISFALLIVQILPE